MNKMDTDDIMDLYFIRTRQLEQVNAQMKNLRQDIKKALLSKDWTFFSNVQMHADTVAKEKHRIEDSLWMLEDELGARFEYHKPECNHCNQEN